MIKTHNKAVVLLLAAFLFLAVQEPVLAGNATNSAQPVIQAVPVQDDPITESLNAIFVMLLIIIAFLVLITILVAVLLSKTRKMMKERIYRLSMED